jgi:hypothetical protein
MTGGTLSIEINTTFTSILKVVLVKKKKNEV